ncbi:MAG: shikimate dehydrogenase [Gemmataceae bacterium]|nr:shikimate dehydrogenase [Gemmataceae bacterium]
MFKQDLAAVFGQPVAENPTQPMMEAAFRAMGLGWRYLTVEVAPSGLRDAVRGAVAMGFKGFNCTLPHKVAVVPLLDELTPAARAIGAVNCVAIRDGRLLGENTDGKGFLESVRAVGEVEGKSAVMLGAGGAARAIGVELLLAGLGKLTVVNRGEARGRELLAVLEKAAPGKSSFVPWKGDFNVPAGTDLVINATSVGLFPDGEARLPLDAGTLARGMVVCDVIPNPPRTRLVRDAEAAGCTVLDGLGMLVNQGVIGVRLWSGRDPDPAAMRAALLEVFGG